MSPLLVISDYYMTLGASAGICHSCDSCTAYLILTLYSLDTSKRLSAISWRCMKVKYKYLFQSM